MAKAASRTNEQLTNNDSGKTNMIDPEGNIKTPNFAAASKQYKKQSSYK